MNAYERTSYFDLGQTVKFIETLGVEDSQATLLRALQAGKIVATGCRIAFNPSDAIDNNQFPRHLRGMGVREIITPHGWADLTFGTVSGGALGVLEKMNATVRRTQGFIGTGIRLKRNVNEWREAWADILFVRTEVETAFQPNTPQPPNRRRVGRAPEFDWPDAMAFAVQQLDQRGDYDTPQNAAEEWRSQADLMRLILAYMGKHNGREPAESAVKSHLSKTIQQWRVGQK